MKILLTFTFFHYIWFIDSENLSFILILKVKMTRFWHLILLISLPLITALAPPSNKHRTSVSKFNKRRGRLLEEIRYSVELTKIHQKTGVELCPQCPCK